MSQQIGCGALAEKGSSKTTSATVNNRQVQHSQNHRMLERGQVVRLKQGSERQNTVDGSHVRQLLGQASRSSSWEELNYSQENLGRAFKKVISHDTIEFVDGRNLDSNLANIRNKNRRLLELNDPTGSILRQHERRK